MDFKKLQQYSKEERVKLLYREYGNQLFRYANSTWKIGEDESWDLVYKAIYKITDMLLNLSFEVEQQFRSYLFKLFINLLKNHLRDEKVKKGDYHEVDLNDSVADSTSHETVSPQVKKLNLILEEMEEWQRILLLMRAQDFSYQEISKFVNKPTNQLKVYYARLKKQLEKKIEFHEKNEVHEE